MVRSINVLSAVAVTLSTGVFAEFRIYYALDSAFGGDQGTGMDWALMFMPGNSEISCDAIEDKVTKEVMIAGLTEDLTLTSGFVCEGCNNGDQKTWEFDVERLEFTDESDHPITADHPGVITLYKSGTEFEYDMVYFDEAGGDIVGNGGKCVKTQSDNAHTFDCQHWGGAWSGTHFFTCDGDLADDDD